MNTSQKSFKIASLPGDGIGPEVTAAALQVLESVCDRAHVRLDIEQYPIGGAAIDETGNPLPEETREGCLQADAVLLGAVGGPDWDHLEGADRPESGLLGLRELLGTYANLRPIAVPASLAGASPLKRELVEGVDLLVVRELTGGIYFGKPSEKQSVEAVSTMRYTRPEIERIARVAFKQARSRTGRVTSVDKANVLAASQLWREVVRDLHQREYADVELNHLYVDNAAMQMVLYPKQFDVILTSNLFGDILSDLSAALTGSLGMLPSASTGRGPGLFEPVHGSAPDIAGSGKANPLAMILSTAMMMDELGTPHVAEAIRRGARGALDAGYRTADLAQGSDDVASTKDMADAVLHHATIDEEVPA